MVGHDVLEGFDQCPEPATGLFGDVHRAEGRLAVDVDVDGAADPFARGVALQRGASKKLKAYKPAKPIGLVTLGPTAGIAQLPFGRLDFLTMMKQKDFFVPMYLGK